MTVTLFRKLRREFMPFLFVIGKFDLDQLMMLEGGFQALEKLFAQAALPNVQNRFQPLSRRF
jgi:hypothetical protein